MAIPENLGRLKRLELRDVWPNEATSFTPWLAREENLRLLGEAIGADLGLESQERPVGPFRADLLLRDLATEGWVLVENQIERTDHSHLGQLITYAAGLKAATIVWLAARFTDEHRAALDWLNEVTPSEISSFGLEVEVWRIGDSAPAPKFNVVSRPNEFSKRTVAETHAPSESNLRYIPYWQAFKETVEAGSKILRPMKPLPNYWTNLSIGRTGFQLRANASMRDGYITAELVIHDDPEGTTLEELVQRAGQLAPILATSQLDQKLGAKSSTFGERRTDVKPSDLAEWPAQHQWMLERLEALHRAFAGPIRERP